MTTTLKTGAARAAVMAGHVTAAQAKKIEALATTSTTAAARGTAVDAYDPAKSFSKADQLSGKERALFHAAFKELAGNAGAALAALADGAPPTTRSRPSLFTKDEVAAWRKRADAPYAKKDYEAVNLVRTLFEGVRLSRAAQHPGPVADALLILVGTRGAQVPTMDDAFTDLGRGGSLDSAYGAPKAAGIDVAKAAAAHDTPANRRLVHAMLAGFLAMPTTVAGSGAVRYFLGTGSFAGKDKPGVGLMSSSNAWAKEAGWKNPDTERVITSLFAHHYGSGEWNGIGALLTQPKGGFTGYPEGDLWDAARESDYKSSPFAMTHSERNKDFIGALMKELEGRGLGEELQYAPPKLNAKLTPSVAKKALLERFEAQWDQAIVAWNAKTPQFPIEGKARDQDVHVWEKAVVTRDGVKEQLQTVGGGYGHFKAVIVSTPEGVIKEVLLTDQRLSRDDLKDPARPWAK